jgi:hypothetical protein
MDRCRSKIRQEPHGGIDRGLSGAVYQAQGCARERPMVLVIAGSVDQARTVFGFVKGFLKTSPTLRREVIDIKRQEIELKNGVIIAVHSNSFRTVRGRTLAACVFDEVSFWRDETSATPDVEMYRAVMPAMATTKGMLVAISSPYRKLGLLYQKWRDHFGQNNDGVAGWCKARPRNSTPPSMPPRSPPSARPIRRQRSANGTRNSAPISPASSATI